ncbi:hypothetical protein SASPL_108475 [Salvia splendens]|uniref:Hexosyltransferase n=1 Tax=Salvia splendens TaxID=180675 RepID=A0A8X9A8A4_SALSN|nr:hypothetical protein SASPL_108475 [Salvia splendens]
MAPEIMNRPLNRGLAKAGSLPSRAYVTFLAGNGDYVKGVVGLAKGLRKVNTIYPLVVAVLPDVPAGYSWTKAASSARSSPCTRPRIRRSSPCPTTSSTTPSSAFGSKMIYLDGDIQVFENIDHLFEMESGYLYAVMDCFCKKTWSHTPQFQIGYCQQSPERVEWPESLGPKPHKYFNAGMLVFEPSLPTYHDQLQTLKVTAATPFAEQDFLNMFFREVYRPIPNNYNLVLAMLWRHPGELADGGGQGGALLRRRVQAVAIHRRGGEHGSAGHEDAGG